MSEKLLIIITLCTVFLAGQQAVASATSAATALHNEETWIASLQQSSGVIPINPGSTRIVPYFTNLGLLGLVENGAYVDIVRNWAQWYTAHINTPDKWGVHGSIYDYELRYGRETPTHDYDSSDSYAATFLTVMRRYYDATADEQTLKHMEDDLRLIASAIYSTMDPEDQLTNAKPNYPIKYLMDNAEVYMGLIDWAYMLDAVFDDSAEAEKTRQHAADLRKSLLSFWQGDRFSYAKDNRGKLIKTDWNTWYPDATAQLFPIWTGVLDPTDAKAEMIWNLFNTAHPEWVEHGHPDAFPWTIVGYTAALMQDWDKVQTYVNTINDRYSQQRRPWPWYVAEAGWYVQTLRLLANTSQ